MVTVQFQRFGTILTFLPEILPNDVIRLDVEPVISQLNFAQGTTVGTAAWSPRSLNEARGPSSSCGRARRLAIAGLLQSTHQRHHDPDPGAGRPADRRALVQRQLRPKTIETETIVLVTPELVSPLDKNEVTEAPGDRVYQPTDPEFYLLGRIEGKLGREFRATVGQQDPLNLMKHFQSEQQWVVGPHGHAD